MWKLSSSSPLCSSLYFFLHFSSLKKDGQLSPPTPRLFYLSPNTLVQLIMSRWVVEKNELTATLSIVFAFCTISTLICVVGFVVQKQKKPF